MQKNRGIIHIFIVILGIFLILVLLGFFNSVQRNIELRESINSSIKSPIPK